MRRVVVVGSGPSGVHFALTLLDKGYEVTMLDAGMEKPPAVEPDSSLDELKARLKDPAAYLLGDDFDCVSLPESEHEFYAFPPSKQYVFAGGQDLGFVARGFAPLFSYARGGLAEAWTGGVYPLTDAELQEFPFTHAELAPYYAEVARRIGINGADDDLARFFPVHDHLLEPLQLSRHAQTFLRAYSRQRGRLNRNGCYVGRSRIATLTSDRNGRKGCTYTGRCLWGCPTGALYTPSLSLQKCLEHPNFRYVSGSYVSHFTFDSRNRITGVSARTRTGTTNVNVDILVLAAGTLSTSRIFLESIYRGTGEIVSLSGLMDNQQILMPYVNLAAVGAPYDPRSYQFHQMAMGLESERPEEYVHSQITALTTALVHPLVQKFPVDLRTATTLFRNLRSALGIINVNLHDRRRPESRLSLEVGKDSSRTQLLIDYAPDPAEAARIRKIVSRISRVLLRLGCVVPPGMTHVRPKGAGVHYSGTMPMCAESQDFTVSPHCQSRDFDNLFLVDGTTFPFLPAKNITFTLMANAVRIADQAF